jgi:hypothetical protein
MNIIPDPHILVYNEEVISRIWNFTSLLYHYIQYGEGEMGYHLDQPGTGKWHRRGGIYGAVDR